MANHPQAEKTSEVDEGLQTPQIVARAADLTRYIDARTCSGQPKYRPQ
jgi:hypothetical protein